MEKVIILISCLVFLCSCDTNRVHSFSVIDEVKANTQLSDVDSTTATHDLPKKDTVIIIKKPLLVEVYTSQAGLTELTGNNDGPHIAAYHRAAGLNCPRGCPYCASGVKWCFDQAKIQTTITAWSPTAHNANNVVFKGGKFYKDPMPGDVITIYYTNLGRIGHTGFFHSKVNERVAQTFEFNTNSSGSRDGGGNYFKYRPFHTLYSITRWTEN